MNSPASDPRQRRPGAWASFLAVCAAVVLVLPVAVLPLTTAVPPLVWVPLLAVGLALIVWMIARRRRRWARPLALGLVAAVAAAAVGASQLFAATPPISGPDGEPLPGSIASLEQVTLNGSEQWITIRGRDTTNPVLLNLGMGGPGGGGFATRTLFEPLEEHFTVVSWDEPGTGRSYGAVPVDQLTRQRFVDDAAALATLVRDRFGQDRIYLYGVSWTSIPGIWLVQEHPDLFHAFVSSGQMVNTVENDQMGYGIALEHLDAQGETARADRLRSNGPPPYHGDGVVFRYVAYLEDLNEIMGEPRLSLIVPVGAVPGSRVRAGGQGEPHAWADRFVQRGVPPAGGPRFRRAGGHSGGPGVLLRRPRRRQRDGLTRRGVSRDADRAPQGTHLARRGSRALG